MKKLSLSFAVVLMCLMVACSSDPDVESGDVLVIKNTPFATVAPTVKAEIIHSPSPSPSPSPIPNVTETPTSMKTVDSQGIVETQNEGQKSSFEIISNMKKMWDQGYSHHSMLNMNMTISFDDYLEDMPMLMEGDVQNSRNYKGVTSFEDNGQIEMIEVIVMDKHTYAKYPNTKYWIQFPEDQEPVNPVTIINLINNNDVEGEFVGIEKSGGTSSQRITIELKSEILGQLLPVLEDSIGTLKLDLWIDSDTNQVVRILITGMAIGGQRVKGPDGQEVTIEVDIEMSSWDFGKQVEFSKPELPSMPEPMVWDSAPEITLQDDKDYSAIIKIYGGGEIKIDLFEDKAPVTVNNFIFLSEEGYYDWVTFHRVIPEFMAQGGDPSGTGRGGPGYFIGNEFHAEARHDSAGILSMANSGPSTNGSQFFITHLPTPWLDNNHTVFGEVIDKESQQVVNNICQGDIIEKISIVGDLPENEDINSILEGWNQILK